MRSLKKIVLTALTGVVIFSGIGFAEMLNGKVKSADPATRKLSIQTVDAATGRPASLEVWVDTSAGFEGVSSFSDIKPGDQLWFEALADTEGNLRASKIAKT